MRVLARSPNYYYITSIMKSLVNTWFWILLFWMGIPPTWAQHRLGIPTFQHFSPNAYEAFNQVWSVRQDPRGLMYFAAGGEGSVLEYDGQRWKKIRMPKPGGVYSLDIDKNGRVWVGAYGDCGYVDTDSAGRDVFRSITADLPEPIPAVTNFWSTAVIGEDVFFSAFGGIVRYHDRQVQFIKPAPGARFLFIFPMDSSFWSFVPDQGLFEWNRTNQKMSLLKGGEFFGKTGASAVLPYNEHEKLVVTRKSGCFRYDPVAGSVTKMEGAWPEKTSFVSGAILLSDTTYLLHTVNAGFYVLDKNGRLLMHITSADGLPVDNIKSAYQSKDGEVWLTTENGIVCCDLLNPVSYLNNGRGFKCSVISLQRFGDQMFIGTTQGLYRAAQNTKEIALLTVEKIVGVDFRTGNMDSSGGLLAIGGAEFAILDKKFSLVYHDDYVTQALCRLKGPKQTWLLGARNRLVTFDLSTKLRKALFELHDEVLSLIQEDTAPGDSLIIWAGFYTRGIARIVLSPSGDAGYFRYLSMPDGYTFLSHATGHLSALTMKGLYRVTWNDNDFHVSRDSTLGPLFNETDRNVFQLAREDSAYWVLSRSHILRVTQNAGRWSYDSTLFYNVDIGETAFAPDGRYFWAAGTDGIALYDRMNQRNVLRTYPALIRSVRIKGDSMVFRGRYPDWQNGTDQKTPTIAHALNTFSIGFSASDYLNLSKMDFSWKMEGFDDDWTAWNTDNRVTYTNLNEGVYLFHVRSRNQYHVIGTEDRYRFVVKPPWWRTWWFRLILIAMMTSLLWVLYQYRVNRLLAMERLRVKIASDLHDDIGADLSKISMYSELIQHESGSEDSKTMLKTVGELSRNVVSSMSDIVWSIDARSDRLQDLIRRMKIFANSLFDKKDVRVKFETSQLDVNMTLPILIKQNFYLIYKEALNNIFKHSNATEVEIVMRIQGRQLSMTISDNGRGFVESEGLGGHGMKNIRMRAETLRGSLKIVMEGGVKIHLSVPIKN